MKKSLLSLLVIKGMLLAGLALPVVAKATDITVIGTAHLEQLQPRPTDAQVERVVDVLAAWQPSLVCIEALPGDQVQVFLRDPARHGILLQAFGSAAAELATRQQIQLALDPASAREAASTLARAGKELPASELPRLAALHLAAHEPWSAALAWSAVGPGEREAGRRMLGADAVAALDRLVASDNEIARIALPLARRAGHWRFCHADSFVDEASVVGLADALMPMMQDPAVARGLEAFNAQGRERWKAGKQSALLDLLAWMQGDAFAAADRSSQWDIFEAGQGPHHAGQRRLALWQARNADIATRLFRAAADEQGGRILLLVGAAHRPFLEPTLAAQAYTRLVPGKLVLDADTAARP